MKLLSLLDKWKGALLALILSAVLIPLSFELLVKFTAWILSFLSINMLEKPYVVELFLPLNGLIICGAMSLLTARLTYYGRRLLFLFIAGWSCWVMLTKVLAVNVVRVYLMDSQAVSHWVIDAVTYGSPLLFLLFSFYLYGNADRVNERLRQFFGRLRQETNQLEKARVDNSSLEL